MNTSNPADKTNTSTNPKKEAGIPQLTGRDSALHAEEFPAPRMSRKVRKKPAGRLFLVDPGLPCPGPGEASRKIFRAIAERQDRLAGGLLLELNETGYRLDNPGQAIHPEV